jgi:hypothetical protein
MSESEHSGLSGVWEGLFSYPRLYQPTPFTAVLLEFGGSISGTIHELCNNGRSAGKVLNSTVDGSCAENSVQFVKVYDPATPGHGRPITYVGALNSDATEIEGQWTVQGSWSGKFLLIRTSRQPDAAVEHRRRALPVT